MSSEDCYSVKAPKVNELLKTLSDPVRREVIRYFEDHSSGETASLEELVTHIESRMPTKTDEDLLVTLDQVHLPTLEQKGWVEFDTRRNTIRYHGHAEAEQLMKEMHEIFSA